MAFCLTNTMQQTDNKLADPSHFKESWITYKKPVRKEQTDMKR